MPKPLEFETLDEEVEFWESESTADYWDEMERVEFEVDLQRNLLHPKLIFITERPAQCPRCRHDLEETAMQYVALHEGRLVIIRDVPALRCRVNRHEFMQENTLDQIEQVLALEQTQKLRPAEMLHVPVFKLGMAA